MSFSPALFRFGSPSLHLFTIVSFFLLHFQTVFPLKLLKCFCWKSPFLLPWPPYASPLQTSSLSFKLLAIKNGSLLSLSEKFTITSLLTLSPFLLFPQSLAQNVTESFQGCELKVLVSASLFLHSTMKSHSIVTQWQAGFVTYSRSHSGQTFLASVVSLRCHCFLGWPLSWSFE